ncbi:hypothetical protein AgCh_013554 [Apium graveolens]
MNPGAPKPKDGAPLLLAPNDNSGERAAPSDAVPGPSGCHSHVPTYPSLTGCGMCKRLLGPPHGGLSPDPDPAFSGGRKMGSPEKSGSSTEDGTGSAHGPNWEYNWGWGSTPNSGWGYGSGSGRSPNGFGKVLAMVQVLVPALDSGMGLGMVTELVEVVLMVVDMVPEVVLEVLMGISCISGEESSRISLGMCSPLRGERNGQITAKKRSKIGFFPVEACAPAQLC